MTRHNDGWFGAPKYIPQVWETYDPFNNMRHMPTPCNQPPVIAAVGAAVVAGGGFSAIAAGTFALGAALSAGAISLAFSGLSMLLAPDPPSADDSFGSIRSSGATRQVRQPIVARRIVYGDVRVSGAIVYITSTNDNQFLHMVVAHCSHEVEEIGEVYINEVSITDDVLNGNNIVNTGRFDGLIRINKHLGTAAQTADTDLVAESSEWTTDHRLQGIAYTYVRLKWDRDAFPAGIPNISVQLKGRKMLDTRDSTTKYTPNIALMAQDYLSGSPLGFSADISDIKTASTNAAANTCDEMVTTTLVVDTVLGADAALDTIELQGEGDRLKYQLGDRVQFTGGSLPAGISAATNYFVIPYQRKDNPRIKIATSLENAIAGTAVDITGDGTGTITKNAEPRYHGGGIIKTSGDLNKNLEEILSGMSGQAVHTGGTWEILAGEYQTPTIYFDESDFAGPIKTQTKVSRPNRYNLVQGVYTSPINGGNPSDYPLVQNSTYQTQDGETLQRLLDLAFTQRAHTAQRIAKIDLERSRQEIIVNLQLKLSGMKVQVGNNFFLTIERYGWDEKIFEVIEWGLSISDGRPVVDIVARENSSSVYDWNNGEETAVDPAPNTNLPNAFEVAIVEGFSLDSIFINTKELDRVYSVVASWDVSDNQFVVSGGGYEVQFKETTESVFNSAGRVDGDVTELILPALKPDIFYDVRIFAYNNFGARSQPVLIEDFKAGDTVTTDVEDWENESLARDGDDWEVDNLPSEDWET